MNIIRIDAPISEVLKIANEWTEKVGLKPAKGVNKISKREPICIGCQENNVFKAGRAGEKDGHPFRGNQHTGGKGGGAKLPSPSKGKPRPKPPMKRGKHPPNTPNTIIDEPSRKKAQKVFEYMIIPARRIKKPNVRAYAVSRTNQMTSGIARPKGMSAKYNMTVDQVRGIEIMLSKIFASGRKKYNI